MTRRHDSQDPRQVVIDDPGQIPSSFASEDEEREWWATHHFSARFYEQRHPGWDDVAAYLLSPLYATRVPHVEHPLRIARKHLAYIQPDRPMERSAFYDTRYEHALIAIIFSAAAVEAGLNLYLLAPYLRLTPERRTILVETPQQVREPVQHRLKHVAQSALELRDRRDLVRGAADLLARRDTLAHAFPPTRGDAMQDLRGAREHYEAAYDFLDHLLLPAVDNRVVDRP